MGSLAIAVTLTTAAMLTTGCVTRRERPTGPESALGVTSVAVTEPVRDAVVGADSLVDVVVEASGVLAALEYVALRVSLPDTVGHERRVYAAQRDAAQETFQLRVPKLPTGVNLEIRGVAENVLGERFVSEPVFVVIIDCVRFPFSCGG